MKSWIVPFVAASCAAFFAAALWSGAARAAYVGCGVLHAPNKCDGCGDIQNNCQCADWDRNGTYYCSTDEVICTNLASGSDPCYAPDSGKHIYTRVAYCKKRSSCNNSQGQDLGACNPMLFTCSTSQPYVPFGELRTEYYEQGDCTCP